MYVNIFTNFIVQICFFRLHWLVVVQIIQNMSHAEAGPRFEAYKSGILVFLKLLGLFHEFHKKSTKATELGRTRK